ncbi:MAG: DUF2799 domain-containing protein [Pseudomonadota bacterium]
MRVWVFAGLGAAAVFALSSCATLNEEQCQVTDWRTLGQTDGGQGRPQSFVAEHQSACSRFGISVDSVAWTSGWQEGIRNYCVPSNGLTVGQAGRTNFNACPADQAAGFNEAYNVGRSVYDARAERDRLQRELNTLITALSDSTPEDLPKKQTEIELKRSALVQAQFRVSSAENALNLFQTRLAQQQTQVQTQ